MKKSTMQSLVNYFAFQNGLPSDVADAVDELKAELAKNEEKAQANRTLYAQAHDVVMAHLSANAMTVAELYEACKDELPEGMSKSKVQYALLNYWASEVVKANDGKVNTYAKA